MPKTLNLSLIKFNLDKIFFYFILIILAVKFCFNLNKINQDNIKTKEQDYHKAALILLNNNKTPNNTKPIILKSFGYTIYLILFYKLFGQNNLANKIIFYNFYIIFLYIFLLLFYKSLKFPDNYKDNYKNNFKFLILSVLFISVFSWFNLLASIFIFAILFLVLLITKINLKQKLLNIFCFSLIFLIFISTKLYTDKQFADYLVFAPQISQYLISPVSKIVSDMANISIEKSTKYINNACKQALLAKLAQKSYYQDKNYISCDLAYLEVLMPWIFNYKYLFLKYLINSICYNIF